MSDFSMTKNDEGQECGTIENMEVWKVFMKSMESRRNEREFAFESTMTLYQEELNDLVSLKKDIEKNEAEDMVQIESFEKDLDLLVGSAEFTAPENEKIDEEHNDLNDTSDDTLEMIDFDKMEEEEQAKLDQLSRLLYPEDSSPPVVSDSLQFESLKEEIEAINEAETNLDDQKEQLQKTEFAMYQQMQILQLQDELTKIQRLILVQQEKKNHLKLKRNIYEKQQKALTEEILQAKNALGAATENLHMIEKNLDDEVHNNKELTALQHEIQAEEQRNRIYFSKINALASEYDLHVSSIAKTESVIQAQKLQVVNLESDVLNLQKAIEEETKQAQVVHSCVLQQIAIEKERNQVLVERQSSLVKKKAEFSSNDNEKLRMAKVDLHSLRIWELEIKGEMDLQMSKGNDLLLLTSHQIGEEQTEKLKLEAQLEVLKGTKEFLCLQVKTMKEEVAMYKDDIQLLDKQLLKLQTHLSETSILPDEKMDIIEEKPIIFEGNSSFIEEKATIFEENSSFIEEKATILDLPSPIVNIKEKMSVSAAVLLIEAWWKHIQQNRFRSGRQDEKIAYFQMPLQSQIDSLEKANASETSSKDTIHFPLISNVKAIQKVTYTWDVTSVSLPDIAPRPISQSHQKQKWPSSIPRQSPFADANFAKFKLPNIHS